MAKKKAAKKKTTKRRPQRAARPSARAAVRKPMTGIITHTELVSSDPPATQGWCERVLGWKFGEPMPSPVGPYHMWRFSNMTGGGIRVNNPTEGPGSIPYCEVKDIHASYSKALANGGSGMMPPEQLPGDKGWIAIVAAPGGVPIGLWAGK